MGTGHSTRRCEFDGSGEVNFDHFQILRAIGKGSFGKVCIVQKKDSNQMYAMKYMNKSMCIEKDAVSNVLREVEILRGLDHPFLVNVWFTFQDREDMFMVVDLLLGGDLRYHMQAENKFSEARVKLYVCEIALALDYLQSKHILHRDIKPDNILLDEEGHVHITDFNIATFLEDGQLATSLSGTKPYMAPEVFRCARGDCLGYSYPVDWWALGMSMYEMLRGKRPYEIHGNDTVDDVIQMFDTHVIYYSTSLEDETRGLLTRLLNIDPRHRISTFSELKNHPYMSDVEFDHVLHRKIKPSFIPSKEHLNCDPTFELEEMIIESKPLHKKKKRLAKQLSRPDMNGDDDPLKVPLENLEKEFLTYNRERELVEKQTLGNGSQCDVKQTPLCSNNNARGSPLTS